MKTTIAIISALALGFLLGWHSRNDRARKVEGEIVKQMMNRTEASDRQDAARSVRAIELIQSGDTQRAVELLLTPIAYYDCIYDDGHTNEEEARVRAHIGQLSRDNSLVSTRIAETRAKRGLGSR